MKALVSASKKGKMRLIIIEGRKKNVMKRYHLEGYWNWKVNNMFKVNRKMEDKVQKKNN